MFSVICVLSTAHRCAHQQGHEHYSIVAANIAGRTILVKGNWRPPSVPPQRRRPRASGTYQSRLSSAPVAVNKSTVV